MRDRRELKEQRGCQEDETECDLAELDRIDGDTAVIAMPMCPLRPLVTERPEAALIAVTVAVRSDPSSKAISPK